MTCIVSILEKGKIYMGGDSAGIAGLSISIRDDPKVFTNGPFIIGFTSSFRMGQILRFKFHPPKQTIHQSDYEYMVTDFIDSVRECFSKNGFGDRDATMGGTFLVGYKGKLYTIEKDHQVGIPNTPYDAVGCGADLALGSLYTTQGSKLSPEERITLALKAASAFNAGVAPPFLIMEEPENLEKNNINKKTIVKKTANKKTVSRRS